MMNVLVATGLDVLDEMLEAELDPFCRVSVAVSLADLRTELTHASFHLLLLSSQWDLPSLFSTLEQLHAASLLPRTVYLSAQNQIPEEQASCLDTLGITERFTGGFLPADVKSLLF